MIRKGLFSYVTSLLLASFLVLVFAGQSFGAIIRVKQDSPNNGPGSDWDHAYHTVTAGLAAAVSGDEVWVAKGTYVERITLKSGVALYGGFAGTETSREQRSLGKKLTVLDGNQGGAVVKTPSGAVLSTRIDGFTIRNGTSSGISCTSSSPTICNNTITENSGGGIYCYCSSPLIANNVIAANNSSQGGAIFCNARWSGASSSPIVCNNTIVANESLNDGVIDIIDNCSPTLSNNIVAFNSSGLSGGPCTLKNNCFYNPDDRSYDHFIDPTNIGVDPRLVAVGYGQLHIQPDSPCRDSGYDQAVQEGWLDTDGQPRIQGSHVDIGADESDGTQWTYTPAVIRVSPTGNDTNDGSSWLLAKRTVQAGINAAYSTGGEVWVAAGTYGERILLRPYAYCYGGFTGTEESRDQRDWKENAVILDGGAAGSVVTAEQVGYRICAIDGFTIRNGNAAIGGGILCKSASPLIENNTITCNSVASTDRRFGAYGGGIYCSVSQALIRGNLIFGNTIIPSQYVPSGTGVGIYAYTSSLAITNNAIYANGGPGNDGIVCSHCATGQISNNIIRANQGSGVVAYGGYIFSNFISGNSDSGIYCSDGGGPEIYNNTVAGNGAYGVYCYNSSSPFVYNNIIAFNPIGIEHDIDGCSHMNNCVYNPDGYNYLGMRPGTGDIQVDPKLCDAAHGELHIQPGSPCIDFGDDSSVLAGIPDIDGQARIQGRHVDIGADESAGTAWTYAPVVLHVSPNGSDTNDGTSWALAKRTIRAGAAAASLHGGEVWVAAGTYANSVFLPSYACLYAGFAGGESAREQRDPIKNATVVDGGGTSLSYAVTGLAGSKPTITGIDGFTIRNGGAGGVQCNGSVAVSGNTITANKGDGVNCAGANSISGNTITSNTGNGINCGSSSSPAVSKNVISNNACGIYLNASSGVVTQNVVSNNKPGHYPGYGGGIYASGSTALISSNRVIGNSSSTGAGIACDQYYYGTITDNVISGNSATQNGGGIYCSISSPIITNNTIVSNTAAQNGGGAYYPGSAFSNNIVAFCSSGIYGGSGLGLRNNCVYNPGSYNYSGLSAGQGDISVDPLFANRFAGDYHLRPASPCINAGWNDATGIPAADMDGEARLNGTIDIGADEYWPGTARSVADAKAAGGGSAVDIYGGIVTAAFGDSFYVEADDRASGMLVKKPGHSLQAGNRARIVGSLAAESDPERCIEATVADPMGTGSVAALAMPMKSVGGGSCGLQGGVWGWITTTDANGEPTRVWDQAKGLNNIGLLITTVGKVTGVESAIDPAKPTWFTIDDGSGLNLKCSVPSGVTIDPGWQCVRVTGVSSCESVGSELHALIKLRTQTDISAF